MKIAYEYLLTDGNRGIIALEDLPESDESEFRKFLKDHKTTIDSITVTLEDGRKFTYERQTGWKEVDTPF